MKRVLLALLLLAVSAAAGCDKKRGMETRTYELNRLSNEEAQALLTPYIREGGYIAGKQKLISVTEKPDRLQLIADLLRRYDGPALDVLLDVRLLQADGGHSPDSAIADIEPVLRQTFRYAGYRLLGSTRIQTREGEPFMRTTPQFSVSGQVRRLTPGDSVQRVAVSLELRAGQVAMASTVTAALGKPVVIGQADGAGGALIVVLRPSPATP